MRMPVAVPVPMAMAARVLVMTAMISVVMARTLGTLGARVVQIPMVVHIPMVVLMPISVVMPMLIVMPVPVVMIALRVRAVIVFGPHQ